MIIEHFINLIVVIIRLLFLEMSKLQEFVKDAKNQALKSTVDRRHGAVLIHRGKLVGAGYNGFKCFRTVGDLKSCLLCS